MEKKLNVYMCQVNYSYGNNVFVPYSVGSIVSYCKTIEDINKNYDFKKFLFLRTDTNEVVNDLESPSIFGFSNFLWNFEYNKNLAKKVKEKFPECLIVFGGPHISKRDDFFKECPYVDLLVHGEGECIFSNILLEKLNSSADFKKIKGITINNNGTSLVTELSSESVDLNSLPSPYLTSVFDNIWDEKYSFTASFETNRGCPYSCTFCMWGFPDGNMKKIRQFSDERIDGEIKWFGTHKIDMVFCCDANFGILKRDLSIINKLCEVKKEFGYPKKFRTSYAKNSDEVIFEMNRILDKFDMAKGATLSFQSCNEETLNAIKRKNMDINEFRELMKMYNDNNISTHSEIIIGLPKETLKSFCDGIEKILNNGQDTINIYNCEVLQNSVMGSDEYKNKYGIKTIKCPIFLPHSTPQLNSIQEYNDLVISTDSMPEKDFFDAILFSYFVQALHCLGITRYVSLFLKLEFGISYLQFYQKLIVFAKENKNTVIGKQRIEVSNIIEKAMKGESWGYVNEKFGNIMWPLEEAIFLNIVIEKEKFYKELEAFIGEVCVLGERERALILFVKNVIASPDIKNNFEFKSDYDFVEYFKSNHISKIKCLNKNTTTILVESSLPLNRNLENFAREIVWYGRKGGRFILNASNKDK